MTPPVDALSAIPDGVPSLFWATVRMVLCLAAIGFAAWAVMRWNRRSRSNGRHLEIVDRTFLARGTSIALVRVEGRRLLLGVSTDGVRLIRDIDTGAARHGGTRFDRVLEKASARRETGS